MVTIYHPGSWKVITQHLFNCGSSFCQLNRNYEWDSDGQFGVQFGEELFWDRTKKILIWSLHSLSLFNTVVWKCEAYKVTIVNWEFILTVHRTLSVHWIYTEFTLRVYYVHTLNGPSVYWVQIIRLGISFKRDNVQYQGRLPHWVSNVPHRTA